MRRDKFIHFNTFSEASSVKFSANEDNTSYILILDNGKKVSSATAGTPDVAYTPICFIKDVQAIITHGQVYPCANTITSSYAGVTQIKDSDIPVESTPLPVIEGSTITRLIENIVTEAIEAEVPKIIEMVIQEIATPTGQS